MADTEHPIRAKRKRLGWTQDGLAVKAGIPQQTISKIEAGGVAHLNYSAARALADALKVKLYELLPRSSGQYIVPDRNEHESLFQDSEFIAGALARKLDREPDEVLEWVKGQAA